MQLAAAHAATPVRINDRFRLCRSGVWGGLAGAILLLLRSRWAVWGMGLSLLGAVLGLGYQIAAAPPLAGADDMMNTIMPYVIILIAAALFYYARAMEKNGVLR